MNFKDVKYAMKGKVDVYDADDDFAIFHFEVRLEFRSKVKEDVNQVALYGTLKTNREGAGFFGR